jgi:hypothetical protein
MLASLDGRFSTERCSTENISAHGARVLAKQGWRTDDSLVIKSLEGNFQSEATVVYSREIGTKYRAIGLVLLDPTGLW